MERSLQTKSIMSLRLSSPAFQNFKAIPKHYTAEEAGISPPLKWSGAPAATQELALICEDPDAPLPQPFVHWILYGISPNTSRIPEGIAPVEIMQVPLLARQGKNTMLKTSYTGPNPPPWHRAHRYRFRLFALNAPLPLAAGAGRTEFLKAIERHILDEAELVGLYERSHASKVRVAFGVAGLGLAAGALYFLASYFKKGESSIQGRSWISEVT